MQALFPTFLALSKRLHRLLATQVRKPDIAALWAKFEAAEEASWQRHQRELEAKGLEGLSPIGRSFY